MPTIAKNLRWGSGKASLVDEYFASVTWTGNSGTQAIDCGFDFTGGGLIAISADSRSEGLLWMVADHSLTEMFEFPGNNDVITLSSPITLTSTGFTLPSDPRVNWSSSDFHAFVFRKKSGFFSTSTWTGNNTAGRTIAHGLGAVPGACQVLTQEREHNVFDHRSFATRGTDYILTSTTNPVQSSDNHFNSTAPDGTNLTIGATNETNANSRLFAACFFGHDTASDGFIQCGVYTGNGLATGPAIDLGWEPQAVAIRGGASGSNGQWYDNLRDLTNPRSIASPWEGALGWIDPAPGIDFTPTGFQPKSSDADVNASGTSYYYIAIRKAG